MVSFIRCRTLDKNFIFPIIAGISTLLSRFLLSKIDFGEDKLMLCLISSLSMCLSFIPLIIIKIKYPSLEKQYNYLKDENDTIKSYNEKSRKGFYSIIFTSILDFSVTIIKAIKGFTSVTNSWAFDIIIISFLSYFILDAKLFKHQYLCIIIIVITGIVLNIYDLYNFDWEIISIVYVYLKEIIFCLKICINKFAIKNYNILPYEICFYEGLFSFILYNLSWFGICIYNDKYQKYFEYFKDFFESFDKKKIILISFFIILNFLYNLFTFITVKYYNPCYVINIFIFQEIGSNFINKDIINNTKFYIIIFITFIFFIVFLVFNEIIELNFCDLQKNIKPNIAKRGDNELLNAKEEYDKDPSKDGDYNNDDEQISISSIQSKDTSTFEQGSEVEK